MTPLADRVANFPLLGRIALGYLKANSAGKTYPARSDSLVFTADDRELLNQVAKILGGDVEQAPAQDEGSEPRWRVITGAKELRVRMPTADDRSFSQWYERWGRGGILRRCDGITCQFVVLEPGQPPQRDVACLCHEDQVAAEDRCDPTTRLNVVVEELFQVSRMGLWQITSRGWESTREIAAAVELLRTGGVVAGIPLQLRVGMRTRRARDGKSYDFPVFTLIPMVSFVEAARRALQPPAGLFSSVPALSSGEHETEQSHSTRKDPPTAASDPEPGGDQVDSSSPGESHLTPGNLEAGRSRVVQTPAIPLNGVSPGPSVTEAIDNLRAGCQDIITNAGLSPEQVDRIWKRVRPAGVLTDPGVLRERYRRFFQVLYALSIGQSETAALKGALETTTHEQREEATA